MRDITLGQYYPAKSPVHRMDARAKIIAMILFMVMVFFCNSFMSFAFLTVVVLLLIALSRLPFLRVLKSLKVIVFLVLFTAILTLIFYRDSTTQPIAQWWIFRIYISGIYTAVKLAWRILLLILTPTVMTMTSTPTELTDGLESLLKPLKYIKVPIHELALIMSIALRLVPSLVEETDKITNAQRARGADFDSRNPFKRVMSMLTILIPLFVSSFRRADELADAMDARCFRGASTRTRMKKLKFRFSDALAIIAIALVFVVVLFLRYNYLGWSFLALPAFTL